jgi:hypothetical protein
MSKLFEEYKDLEQAQSSNDRFYALRTFFDNNKAAKCADSELYTAEWDCFWSLWKQRQLEYQLEWLKKEQIKLEENLKLERFKDEKEREVDIACFAELVFYKRAEKRSGTTDTKKLILLDIIEPCTFYSVYDRDKCRVSGPRDALKLFGLEGYDKSIILERTKVLEVINNL